MTLETKEQMIGALALVVLLALLGFMNQSRDMASVADGRIRVDALFGRVDGIAPGAEVRMGGVRPGASEQGLKTGDLIAYTQDAQIVSDILDLIISQGQAAMAERRAAAESATGQMK